MPKRAISTQRSKEGMPTLRSGSVMCGEALTAPVEVRKEIRMVCQKDRKMTSLMAATLRRGWCSRRSSFIWM